MPEFIANRIEKNIDKESKIRVLGLSFKPNSDDVRDTPAAKIIKKLIEDGYKNIKAYDPLAINEFSKHYNFEISYSKSIEECIGDADIIIILTGWDEFKKVLDLTDKPIVDCRYLLD